MIRKSNNVLNKVLNQSRFRIYTRYCYTNLPLLLQFLSTVALPSCVLSPPVRPTSRNEQDGTSQLCDSDFKPVPKSTAIDGSGSRATNCKKQIIHSAGATPSSSSSIKDFRKVCKFEDKIMR